MSSNKLKAWVRYDGQKKIVPSSLILQANKPKVGTWVEIPTSLCCNNINNCNGQILNQLSGDWYLSDQYAPPTFHGLLNFPNHCLGNLGSANSVGNGCVQLYINVYNWEEEVQLLLAQMVGNSGCLRLTQTNGLGTHSVTYSFTNQAFQLQGDIVFFDTIYGNSPVGSLVVTTPSTAEFDDENEVYISLTII